MALIAVGVLGSFGKRFSGEGRAISPTASHVERIVVGSDGQGLKYRGSALMADVVIIGGGPAGAVLGSYLAKAGVDTIILERATHPRPHVGESLVTSTTRVFKDLDFLEKMDVAGFPRKYGAAWHPTTKEGEFSIWFKEFPQEGVDQDYTYHVDRAQFDLMLLQHAQSLGAKVVQGVAAREVLFDGDRANGVRISIDGSDTVIPARVVVDASGRNTILGNQLRLRHRDPIFNQTAVYAWFENVNRGKEPTEDFIHIYFLPTPRAWVWQIPVSDTVTSVGVVAENATFKKMGGRKDDFFHEMVKASPDLVTALADARQVTDFEAEAEYSYYMDRVVGDGWLLIGDAARFVDPIFASGVSIAIYSSKFASEVIIPALEQDDVSAAAFQPYADKLSAGVTIWYDFIRLYYKLQHIFTHFISNDDYRQQLLQLLQGEVFERDEAPVLKAMREVIHTVETTDGHLWKPALTDIPID